MKPYVWVCIFWIGLALLVLPFVLLEVQSECSGSLRVFQKKHMLESKPSNTAILLTMFVKAEEDSQTKRYLEVVNRWLQESSYDIFLIDSANRGLPLIHPRLKQHKFDQDEPFQAGKTHLELKSLNTAFKSFDFSTYKYVVKVTGKYFIPSFHFRTVESAELLCQNRQDTEGQNTEIIGFKVSESQRIMEALHEEPSCMEHRIIKLQQRFSSFRLPKYDLDSYYPRSDGQSLTYL